MALRILHLSDTHLFGPDDARHYGVTDTTAALERVLARASTLSAVDAVVLTGDLSDDGSERSYEKLRGLVEPWAAARGAVVVYAMGNHDGRAGFEAVLGSRERVVEVAGARIVVLDSSVPGAGYGELDASSLEFLNAALAGVGPVDAVASGDAADGALATEAPGAIAGEVAPLGTIVVFHHPPVPALSALLQALELQHPDAVLSLAAAGGVRAILSGHYHHALATTAAGVPVFVAPGITNTSDPLAPAGTERATAGSGFAVIDVPEAGNPRAVFVAVPGPDDGRVLFDLDAATVTGIAREAGPQA